jgi:hypothetical protein
MAVHRAQKAKSQGLESQAGQTIGETHMVVPSVLTLFGFQLMVASNGDFRGKLAAWEHWLYLGSLVAVALAAAIIITPAAFHRQVEPHRITDQYVQLVSVLIPIALALVAVSMSVDVYLMASIVVEKRAAAAALALVSCACLIGCWFVLPQILRRRHNPDAAVEEGEEDKSRAPASGSATEAPNAPR